MASFWGLDVSESRYIHLDIYTAGAAAMAERGKVWPKQLEVAKAKHEAKANRRKVKTKSGRAMSDSCDD